MAMILLYGSILISAIMNSEKSTKSLYSEKLTSIAVAVLQSYDNLMDGSYSLKNGQVYKGNTPLTEDLLDAIYNKDEVHMTIFYGDTRYLTTIKDSGGNRIVGTKASDAVIDTVLNQGKNYISEGVDIQGIKYFATYEPLKNGEEIVGILFIGLEQSKIQEVINGLIVHMVVVGSIIAVVLLAITFVVCMMLVKSIQIVANDLRTLTDGNLNIDCHVKKINKNDEIDGLADCTNKLAERLREVVDRIQKNSGILNSDSVKLNDVVSDTSSSVSNVVSAMDDVAHGATNQAETSSDLMANIEELSAKLDMITSHIDELNERNDVYYAGYNYEIEDMNFQNELSYNQTNNMPRTNSIDLWGLDCINITQARNFISSYNKSIVKVGVVDYGVEVHKELSNIVMPDLSYLFVNNSSSDDYKAVHGTMVAGIIGSRVDNKNMEGVCSDVKIGSLEVDIQHDLTNNQLLHVDSVISAINYAVSKNMRIINCSFGFELI